MGTGSAARRPRLARAHGGALPVMGRHGAQGADRGAAVSHPQVREGCSWLPMMSIHGLPAPLPCKRSLPTLGDAHDVKP